ncbi:5'-nucleotidase C-terminal domain-containing protein [Clostridium lundense]|uniref:5'-nucleotidase C-terminal domain-containing protein n=1 Tax=Clostridium lundense TaxID=319475 RepID=UPI0006871C2E|nr:5'-nucleotidase C-terminal domain-containing protein [Clostridium lundense]
MFNFKKLKNWQSVLIVLLMVFTFLTPSKALAEQAVTAVENNGEINITLVHTNDTHARVKEDKYAGMGFSKIATKIKELRKNNKNVLVLDAGDTLHGQTIASISKGESIINLMNKIGYDAMVPGNHDFNYGKERLVELSQKAKFPILTSNIVKKDNSTLLPNKYIIKEMNGVKVGIFGLSTPNTAVMSHPKNTEGLTFKDPVKTAKEIVGELKDKVDVIVALTHLGVEGNYTSIQVAEQVQGIDIIVDGHSHTTLKEGKVVNNTLIVQTGDYDKNLGIANIKIKDGKVVEKKASLLSKEATTTIVPDKDIEEAVQAIEKENEKITSVVVTKTDIDLDGERANVRTKETNLGNLMAEAMREVSGADIAFVNGGDIRTSIKTGDVTKGNIITVLPFGSIVVLKEVKGSDIVKALENSVHLYPETFGGFLHVSGINVTFDPDKKAGNRICEVNFNGKSIELNKTYKLACNEFVAAGGDGYEMLKSGKVLAEFEQEDEVLVKYINKYGTKTAKVDGRMKMVKGIKKPAKKPIQKPTDQTKPVKPTKPTQNNVVYVVKSGDTLIKIANMYGVSYMEILKLNNIKNPSLIYVGQKFVIPSKNSSVKTTETKKSTTYIVVNGDTLSQIGAKHNVDYKELVKYNNIKNPNLIFVGQKIMIP